MPTAPPLIGTYSAPPLRVGDRATCLFRDRDCKVTSITAAPIPWPRVQPLGQLGGCGLLVTAELVRAIRAESAVALKHHFGVSTVTVWAWRKAFGVGGHATTEGSRIAITGAAQKGAAGIRAKKWTEGELDARAERSKALGLRPGPRWTPERGGWTAAELELLEQLPDADVAERTGRSAAAVRCKRRRLTPAGTSAKFCRGSSRSESKNCSPSGNTAIICGFS